jgi:hypothetical protein
MKNLQACADDLGHDMPEHSSHIALKAVSDFQR